MRCYTTKPRWRCPCHQPFRYNRFASHPIFANSCIIWRRERDLNSRGTGPRDFQSRALPGYAISARNLTQPTSPFNALACQWCNATDSKVKCLGLSWTVKNGSHEASHDALPFRLNDVNIKPLVVDVHPLIPEIRQDLIFQWKLLRTDWNQQFTIAVGSAVLAILLGALNGDIFDGGNAKIAGLEGLQVAGSTAYFQMVHLNALLGLVLVHAHPNVPNYADTYNHFAVDLGRIRSCPYFLPLNEQKLPIRTFTLSDMMGGFPHHVRMCFLFTSSSKQCVKQGTSMLKHTTYTKMFESWKNQCSSIRCVGGSLCADLMDHAYHAQRLDWCTIHCRTYGCSNMGT